MKEVPEIRFARSNGASIAYQVFGAGPVTIAAVPPMAQNIELSWEWPALNSMFDRFGSFARYVHFDKRGTGMSDRGLDIPGIDERVDELRAVMDAAEVDSAHLFGASEGGPMALLFAATYPDRVDGVILECSGASLRSDEEHANAHQRDVESERETMFAMFADRWGTPESMTVEIFAPSLAGDEVYRRWHEKYERQCANRDAIMTLLRMNGTMDVREALGGVEAPVLILHRTGDRVIPVERGRETAALLRGHGVDVRMVELPGEDHFTFAADVDRILDEIERFTTGTVTARPRRSTTSASVAAMGRFEVTVDGESVPTSEWGSKRARTLLKRLIVARGWPVTRDELTELLWPGELDQRRLGARLSVQLSAVRRVLRGGVVADRSSIRLDLDEVDVDVEAWLALDTDDDIVDAYRGDLLPDDRYEDFTGPLREEMRARMTAAAMNVVGRADDPSRQAEVARRVLTVDRFHEAAHHALTRALEEKGSFGAATAAYDDYVAAMHELGVEPASRQTLR